jgi:hypothetical protein
MAYNDSTTPPADTNCLVTALEHAQRLNTPARPPDGWVGQPVLMVPRGWEAEKIYGWEPSLADRIRQKVDLLDERSFGEYFTRFCVEPSLLFALPDEVGVTFTAVFDYHERAQPGSCKHLATFMPRRSVEWTRWSAVNGKAMSQLDFAQFLENNTCDVVNPAGADLRAIVNAFEVDGVIVFQNGSVKFAFCNEQKAKAGELEVPEIFELRFPLWDGEEPVELQARLRYRLSQDGGLKLWFELINPHLVIRDGIQLLIARVTKSTGRPVLLGKPAF